jgi:hypothetical protein
MSEDDLEVAGVGITTNGVVEEKPVVEVEEEREGASTSDFDYLAYADDKMKLFWGELERSGLFRDLLSATEGWDIWKYVLP